MVFVDANVRITDEVKQGATQHKCSHDGQGIAVKATVVENVGQQVNAPGNREKGAGGCHKWNPAMQQNRLYFV